MPFHFYTCNRCLIYASFLHYSKEVWNSQYEPGRRHEPFMMWRQLEWGWGEAASRRLWLGAGWQGVTQTQWQEAFLSAQSQQTLMLVCQSTSFFRCETASVTTRERCCFVGGMPVTKTMIRTSTIALKKKKKEKKVKLELGWQSYMQLFFFKYFGMIPWMK